LVKIAEIWHDSFLGDAEAETLFKKFGYYSMAVPVPGNKPLKLLQINTQVCYVFNLAMTKVENDAGN
jgi:hypothetical protein